LLGAQLISTLTLVEHGQASNAQVAVALRECIDDLRLAIDSLEPAEGDLAPVLLALGAELTVLSEGGSRVVPIESFFLSYRVIAELLSVHP